MPDPLVEQPGGAEQRSARPAILQLHPSLRCNLRCRHCYSVSGPDRAEQLDVGLLERAVTDAPAVGFDVVSVSGGEPFLYRGLGRVLAAAKASGLRTTVTSNGSAITERRLEGVAEHLDGIALSVDGPPERHNQIRASGAAFDGLLRGIERVRSAGVPFGIIHTLTEDGWEDLPWVAEFAAEQGASLLQIHPLEFAGRAEQQLADAVPSGAVHERTYLIAKAIEAHYADRFAVQLDLLLRRDIVDRPEIVYAGADDSDRDPHGPGLDSVVLEEDGALVPISYGFSRRFALGNLHRQGLAEAVTNWRRDGYPRFRSLCEELLGQVRGQEERLVNWHERIVALSLAAHKAVGAGSSPTIRG